MKGQGSDQPDTPSQRLFWGLGEPDRGTVGPLKPHSGTGKDFAKHYFSGSVLDLGTIPAGAPDFFFTEVVLKFLVIEKNSAIVRSIATRETQ